MIVAKFFNEAIKQGIKNDPRGEESVRESLREVGGDFNKLTDEEKKEFDIEKLYNPYDDSRILYDTKLVTDLRSVIVGVDFEGPELLLADTLRQRGRRIDLAIAHHPEGKASANFHNVMYMQAEIQAKFGVPINVAEGVLGERVNEIERYVLSANHNRPVDFARLLGIDYMCLHTPADNHVTTYLQNLINKENPRYVKDIVDLLETIPEYKRSITIARRPIILSGDGGRRAGRIFVDMTGGTGGSKDALEKLSQAGVGTIIGMHMEDDHLDNAKKYNINVVIAGHISSDNLGLNLLFDNLENTFGELEYIECSGFYRIKR